MHALTIKDAVITYVDGPVSEPEMAAIALLIAPEWDIKCREVEDRIAMLAQHAGRKFPV